MSVKQDFNRMVKEFAQDLIETVVANKDDTALDDQQTIADICYEILDTGDVVNTVKAKIKKILKTER